MKIKLFLPVSNASSVLPEIQYQNCYYFISPYSFVKMLPNERKEYKHLLTEANEIETILHSDLIEEFKKWIINYTKV